MFHPKDITEFYISHYISEGDTVVDATAGNGNDTLKLSSAVGKDGKVYAFDIQSSALENTRNKLTHAGMSNFALIQSCHSLMDNYITTPVKAVIFNLGYLPGGDHNIHTNGDTTIEAINKSLSLLSKTGFVSVCIYYGKNSGTHEKEKVLAFLKTLDSKRYTVLLYDFFNRPNNPPLVAIITTNN